ncbi:hypothetical protein BE21_40315, partial [Sorangium cellulosum]
MSGASVSGGSRIARRKGAALALLALLPGCYIDLDGLTGGGVGGGGGQGAGGGGLAGPDAGDPERC